MTSMKKESEIRTLKKQGKKTKPQGENYLEV